ATIIPLPQKSFAFTPAYSEALAKLSTPVTIAGLRFDATLELGSPESSLSVRSYCLIISLFFFAHSGSGPEAEVHCVRTITIVASSPLKMALVVSMDFITRLGFALLIGKIMISFQASNLDLLLFCICTPRTVLNRIVYFLDTFQIHFINLVLPKLFFYEIHLHSVIPYWWLNHFC